MEDKYSGDKIVPPKGVQEAADKGIRWFEDGHGGKGLRPHTIREARAMARGDGLTIDKIRRMRAWFARHSADEGSANQKQSDPTPHEVAWALWGGDEGKRWSEKVMRIIDRERVNKRLRPNN